MARPRFEYLSEAEKQFVHEQTVRLLEEVGIAYNTPTLTGLLKEAGATVDEVALTVDHALMNKAAAVHFQTMFAAWIGSVAEEHGDLLNDYAIEFARFTGEQDSLHVFVQSRHEAKKMMKSAIAGPNLSFPSGRR